jgi:GTPase SAR1 family protein
MNEMKILVVGMPNVGKSSLLNALRRVGVHKGVSRMLILLRLKKRLMTQARHSEYRLNQATHVNSQERSEYIQIRTYTYMTHQE